MPAKVVPLNAASWDRAEIDAVVQVLEKGRSLRMGRRTLEFESRGGIGREAAVPSSPFDPLTWREREGATNPAPVNTGTLFGRADHASDRGSSGGGLFGATSR